jgi:heme/copper-type cytochrome/quinol oxidase subunit 2
MPRPSLAVVVTAIVLCGLLALAVTFLVQAWGRIEAEMSIHGWIALSLGIVFSLVIGLGLMALVFFSARRGYDDAVGRDEE